MRGLASVALLLVLGAACERIEECLPRFGDCGAQPWDVTPDIVAACRDVADAFGHWYDRCGLEFQTGRDVIDPWCASCETISGIDNINTLYDTCLPWIYNQNTCDFENLILDPACIGQLLYDNYENCGNGTDDNGDGYTDCIDPRCSCIPGCSG